MKFKLIIDKTKEEEITATVHERSALTDRIEALVMQTEGEDRIAAFAEDELRMLPIADIECITVLDGKTYAVDAHGKRYRHKQRLYEVEEKLSSSFIRINKSAIANEHRLERFVVSCVGSVDAVFQSGYREYATRRCFAQIKRSFGEKSKRSFRDF